MSEPWTQLGGIARSIPHDTPPDLMRGLAETVIIEAEDSPWLTPILSNDFFDLTPDLEPRVDVLEWEMLIELKRGALHDIVGDAGDLTSARSVLAQRLFTARVVLAALDLGKIDTSRIYCRDLLGLDDAVRHHFRANSRLRQVLEGDGRGRGRRKVWDHDAFARAVMTYAKDRGVPLRQAARTVADGQGMSATSDEAVWHAYRQGRKNLGAKIR